MRHKTLIAKLYLMDIDRIRTQIFIASAYAFLSELSDKKINWSNNKMFEHIL
jgi:hypothetical protein